MRIAFLLTQSLESPSGLGRYWPLAKEMGRLGHQVDILALHHDFRALDRRHFRQEDVEVRYVGQMHVLKRDSTKSHFSPVQLYRIALASTWQLMNHALKTPADAYHLGKPHPMNGLAGWIAARRRKVPLYVDCDDYEAASNRYSDRWQRPIVRWFEDWLPREATGVTVNTPFTKTRLQALGIPTDRIVYVPNGVDPARFAASHGQSPVALRQQLSLGSRPVILYLGTLSLVSHPVDLLIRSFVAVHAHSPEAMLLLVGGGDDIAPLKESVRALGLQNVVQFLGRVHPAEVPAFLRMADVSVDPAHDDLIAQGRSPLKIVESMMVGTPVVTGDVGDRRQILADGQAGLLVRPGSASALAEGIIKLIRNPTLAQRLGEAGRLRAGLFHWDRLVRDFMQVYQQ